MVENGSRGSHGGRKGAAEREWLDTVISALRKLQEANSTNRDARQRKAVEAAVGPLKAASDRLYEYKVEHTCRNRHAAKCIEWLCSESDNGRKGYPALWDALACPEFIGELERWRDLEDTRREGEAPLTRAPTLAYQSYEYAVSKKPELADATDDGVYDWLKENGTPEGYELPKNCGTWKRHVRAGRKYHCTQKNTPRAGREARSVISHAKIESLSEISSRYNDEAD